MSEFLDRIHAAENDIKNANKNLKAVEKEKAKTIKAMENGLENLAAEKEALELSLTSPSFSYGAVDVFLDHVTYQGHSFPLDENTTTEISASGNVYSTTDVKSKNGVSLGGALIGTAIAGPIGTVVGGKKTKVKTDTTVHDNRKLYLTVNTSKGAFSCECDPDDETGVRELAANIRTMALHADTAVATVKGQIEAKKKEIADGKALLLEERNDHSSINAAQDIIIQKEKALSDLKANASSSELAELEKNVANKKRIKIIIGAIVCLLLLIVLIASMFGGNEDKATEESTTLQPTTVVTVTTATTMTVPENAVVEQRGGVWGLYENGVLVDSFTGIASNNLGTWYIKNGLVDFSYTGPVTFNGISYEVNGGQANPSNNNGVSKELNSLQTLFTSLNNSTTREEIDSYIAQNGFEKFAFTHDSGYQIGYESSAVRERGRDREGEAVDINFVTSGDEDNIGKVSSAEYAIHTGFNTQTLLKYEAGTFYYNGNPCASGEEAMQLFLTNQ